MSPAGSSAGRSANRSNAAAVIMGGSMALRLRVKVLRFFAVARTADREEPDRFFMAICHRGSPQVLPDLSNNKKARLVRQWGSRRPSLVRRLRHAVYHAEKSTGSVDIESSIVSSNVLGILCVGRRDQTATKQPPALFCARRLGGGLPITLGGSDNYGGGRYRTRTCDLVRVKHAL